MNRFPLSLRFSIPAILILCGSLLGMISFKQEIDETYKKTEINTRNYLQISAGQTSRILDFLYRREDITEAEISIISQLGSDPNINLAMVIDDKNVIHLSNRYELRHIHISNTVVAVYIPEFNNVREKQTGKIMLSQDQQKQIAIYPVVLPALPNELNSSRMGILFIEYDITYAKKQGFNNALKRSLIFNGSLTIFCLGLWFFFELTLTRRVSQLVAASNSLAEGNLNVRTKLSGSDELMQISVAFDRMASKIQENTIILQEELKNRAIIEVKLKETNENLSISNIELAAATKAKSEFLANMSHEIRTPMNGVIGIAELLSITNLSPEQKELVDTIKDSGNALLNIINDILDFSKIESGNLELEVHPYGFQDIISSVCNLLAVQASHKQINLEYFIDPAVPTCILVDGSRLRQILINLIGNAIKFTHQGGVYVTAHSRLISHNQEFADYELIISIKDTGIGINRQQLDKLFQPFTQADNSISRKYGGTGLGLAISKNLLALMGGTIWVESLGNIGGFPPENWLSNYENKNHQGTIFNFNFIAKASFNPDLISKDIPETKPIDVSKNMDLKILLAEDNKVNQKVASSIIKKIGYVVDIANNGLEVLAMLEKQDYHIILMDMQMPEMDGVTATKMIRKSRKYQPYIIALTASALEEDRQICLDVGMDDFITKPIVIAELTEALKNATPREIS